MKHFILFFLLTFSVTFTFAQEKKKTFVIVHGAWGGSWAFKKVDSLMTAHGHLVYRPSLTGQGERVHLASPDVNLSTHIEDVVNMILFEKLTDVVLIGHSYGGMVITGVADRIPERIGKLIYLDAFLPMDGESVMSGNPKNQEWLKPMERNGMLNPPWVKSEQPVPKDVPQSVKTFTEPLRLKNPKAQSIPGAYILTVDEGNKPEADQFAMFADRAKKRNYTYVEMIADHNPQWSKPEQLVELFENNK